MVIPTHDQIRREIEARLYARWLERHQPEGYYMPAHVRYLCDVAQRLIDGTVKRVCISTPPGHGKSSTITHSLPVWWGQHRARQKIVVTGYEQDFVEKNLSKPARTMAEEIQVADGDGQAMKQWRFKSGSELVARGVGNAPTGINPITLAVIDDPIKNAEQAMSETYRNATWQWWTTDIVQRFWPETRVVIIATRWHHDDLIGRLKRQEAELPEDQRQWEFINLPALAEAGDPLGREVGEALWPEAKPRDFLLKLKRDMGAAEFEALFQGNPTPREGRMFAVGQILVEDAEPPPGAVLVGYADIAATKKGGDYSAFAWCWHYEGRFFIRVRRARLGPKEIRPWLYEQMSAYRHAHSVWVPQDPGAAGKAFADDLARGLAQFGVRTETQSGSKELRAGPLAARVGAGDVVVLPGPDTADFIEELRQFPGGKNDDMVDAAAQAFNKVAAVVTSNHLTPTPAAGHSPAMSAPIVIS